MKLRVDHIKDIIAEAFNMPDYEFFTDTREDYFVYPKQLFCYLAYKYCQPLSLTALGWYVSFYRGKRYDHSSVLHCVKKIKGYISVDRNVRELVEDLEKKVEVKKLELKKLQAK